MRLEILGTEFQALESAGMDRWIRDQNGYVSLLHFFTKFKLFSLDV